MSEYNAPLRDMRFVLDEIANIEAIKAKNPRLQNLLEIRKQTNPQDIFKGIVKNDEHLDLVMCNPPFFSSAQEAQEANLKKVKGLGGKDDTAKPNFRGQSNELWCPGGEKRFLSQMVNESKEFADHCFWFTTLVSKSSHLKGLQNSLDYHKAEEVRVINMSQGNKSSRILAWTFLSKEQQKEWRSKRWGKE